MAIKYTQVGDVLVRPLLTARDTHEDRGFISCPDFPGYWVKLNPLACVSPEILIENLKWQEACSFDALGIPKEMYEKFFEAESGAVLNDW